MKAKSTEIAEQIVLALQAITEENNYLTDLGTSVHQGYYAHVLQAEDTTFPAIILHPALEVPGAVRGNLEAVIESESILVIAARLGAGEEAYAEIQSCLCDTRRALFRAMPEIAKAAGREDIVVGPAEPDISKDSSLVMYAMSVRIKFNENYQTG
jgi:hypothetical protein